MLGRSKSQRNPEEASIPLLESAGFNDDNVIFSLHDDDDDDDNFHSALDASETNGHAHRQELSSAPSVALPLRSTITSRETGTCVHQSTATCTDRLQEFEQDTDDLDDEALGQLHAAPASLAPGSQDMPLLVGLVDASNRRSLDTPLRRVNFEDDGPDIDLEELAAKGAAGGGLLDSIFNMANSILGAGTLGVLNSTISSANQAP
jgi:solute carrier family 38 (sodium-coupled neutral amino acid transporter), member 11